MAPRWVYSKYRSSGASPFICISATKLSLLWSYFIVYLFNCYKFSFQVLLVLGSTLFICISAAKSSLRWNSIIYTNRLPYQFHSFYGTGSCFFSSMLPNFFKICFICINFVRLLSYRCHKIFNIFRQLFF